MFRGQRLSKTQIDEKAREIVEARSETTGDEAASDQPLVIAPPAPPPSAHSPDRAERAAEASADGLPHAGPSEAVHPPAASGPDSADTQAAPAYVPAAPAIRGPQRVEHAERGQGGGRPGGPTGRDRDRGRPPRGPRPDPDVLPRETRAAMAEQAQLAAHEDVDAEAASALDGMDLDTLYNAMDELEGAASLVDAKQGHPATLDSIDLRTGRVLSVGTVGILVDFGDKLQGLVKPDQWEGDAPEVGSDVEVEVRGFDHADQLWVLSTKGAAERASWSSLHKDSVVDVVVVAENKGGLEVEFGGIRGFIPRGQVSLERVDDFSVFVGRSIRARVTELNRRERNVVLSARAIELDARTKQREALLAELQAGDIREGTVRQLMKFGAFVDLGGVDGLLHISDMSYSRVREPGDVVQVGDRVTVQVLKIDFDKPDKRGEPRISLGLKQTQPDPWTLIGDDLAPGDEVSGTITRTAPFGAFCEVRGGVEGLIPISEMSYYQRIRHPDDVVKQGQVVRVKVLHLDAEARKLSLSLKQLGEDPWLTIEQKFSVGAEVFGKITRLAPFGAFCEVAEGVEGLIPNSEVSFDRRVRSASDALQPGKEVRVKVLSITPQERRISLSVKQTGEDPWSAAGRRFAPKTEHTGVVTRVAEFGAFIKLAEGVEGLAHISELSEERVRSVSDVLSEGQEVRVWVKDVELEARRVSLTLKEPAPEFDASRVRDRVIPNTLGIRLAGTSESEAPAEAAAESAGKKEKPRKQRRGGLSF